MSIAPRGRRGRGGRQSRSRAARPPSASCSPSSSRAASSGSRSTRAPPSDELVAAVDALCRRLQSTGDPNDNPFPELPARPRRPRPHRAAHRRRAGRHGHHPQALLAGSSTDADRLGERGEGRAWPRRPRCERSWTNWRRPSARTATRWWPSPPCARADDYTFTHMVNVSILAMVQARGLGIDGTLLREFGVAGLMHDIGKVRTPLEILQQAGRSWTTTRSSVMRRHPVDGARDPPQDARPDAARGRRRLRAPPAAGRQRLPRRRHPAVAQPRHDAVRDRGRLRRDAVEAAVPGGVPGRAHPGGAEARRGEGVRAATWCAASCS